MKIISKNKKLDYLFFFGNSPELTKKEVECATVRLLPFLMYDSMVTKQIARFKSTWQGGLSNLTHGSNLTNLTNTNLNSLSNLQNSLGGTVKIAEVLFTLPNLDCLARTLTKTLIKNAMALGIDVSSGLNSNKKINFAISNYSSKKIDILKICQEIKILLKSDHLNSRFVLPKQGTVLSSAQIFHNRLNQELIGEINILDQDQNFLIARTVTVQNPNDWSKRDFGIPVPDAKSGMLPPKLARIMINLALPLQPTSYNLQAIYDPFCGNGRILLETAILGFNFWGSDIDPAKVKATKKNLRWLRNQYNLKISDREIEEKIFIADSRFVNCQLSNINCQIVTEPDLGPPLHNLPNGQEAAAIANNLLPIYIDAINNLMSKASAGVFIIPAWKTKEGKIIRLFKKILDNFRLSRYYLSKLGEYARPNSFIIREVIGIKNSKSQIPTTKQLQNPNDQMIKIVNLGH